MMEAGLAQAMNRVRASVRGVANGDTEDVVQEACARAIKSGVSLEAEQWLRTVAKRVAIDNHRRRREMPSGAPVELENWVPSNEGNPEDALLRQERSQAVREALATLPPRYRKALLAYAEEDSPAAVASRLGLSASATWTLLSRARSRLRLQLEQVGYVPAMMVSRIRWRGAAFAGAAGVVAATAVVAPHVHNTAPGALSHTPAPKVVHVTSASPIATPGKTNLIPKLPIDATGAVTDKVNDTVGTVQSRSKISVGACLGDAKNKLGVELSVPENPQGLVSQLIDHLPDQLKSVGEKTCQ